MINFRQLLAVLNVSLVRVVVNGKYVGELYEDDFFKKNPDIYRRQVLNIDDPRFVDEGVIVYLGDIMGIR